MKIAIISGVIGITACLYVWAIPAIVNINSHKTFIEEKIFENSGYKIDLGNPKLSMGWFPSIWIRSNNISILNDDSSKALSIDNPQLKLKLLPLLRKKIEISNLSADKEDIYLRYSKKSQFMLGQYPIRLPEQKSEFTLNKMKLDLGEYNIYLDDEKNNEKLSLCGKYIQHGKYIANKHLKLATEGVFRTNNKSTNINVDFDINLPIDRLSEDKLRINANINDFDLSSLSNYATTLTNGTINSLDGIITFNANTKKDDFGHKKISMNFNADKLHIIGKDKASSIMFNDKLSAIIDFRTVENGLELKNVALTAPRIHAKANGKLYNLGHKVPKYDIKAEVKDTRIEDVISILPGSETLLPDFNLYKLKKYVFYGDGEGKLHFQGEGTKPFINGYVKLRNAYLIKPLEGAAENASIDLKFKGHKMFINVFVPTMNNQTVSVKGMAQIDGTKYSELNIKSSESVVLAPAQAVLNPLHEILKFQLGPVPMMTIQGIGNIDMKSAGKKIDPHIWGKINFKDATASFNEIHNLVVNNGSGEVVFNDTQVTFKTYKAYLNGLPIEINGDCSVLGKLNVYVNSKGQDVKKLINAINTSPILVDGQKVVAPFTHPEGIADVFLHIYGTAKNAEEIVFNKDLFAKGKVILHNSKTILQDTFLPFTGINGVVNFDQYNSDYDLTGNVRNSNVHVWGTGTNNSIDLKASSNNFIIGDIFDMLHPDMVLPFKKDLGKLRASFVASYKGKVEGNNLDYNKIKANGKFLSNFSTSDDIKIKGGTFTINNGYLKTSPLEGVFGDNSFNLNFTARDLDKENINISQADFNFKNFDVSSIDNLKNQIKLPKELSSQINNISNFDGHIDISGTIKNNSINANTNLSDISFRYKPFDTAIRILNGRANLRGNTLYLDKINSRVSSMPVFVDGKISNIFNKTPELNLSVSSKLTQNFFDRFFNSKSVYPVKTKGDINFKTKLNGAIDSLSAKSNLNLGENASIYYMGATIAGAPSGIISSDEMTTNPVSIISDMILYPNRIKINSLNYNQTITSQNKKKSIQNLLNASGEIALLKNNIIGFKNFKIKTENPTNAKIFNILFKKPTIKQGVFTTDLTVNGTSETPYAIGFLNVKSMDIPIMNSTIRDVDMDLQKDYIYLNAKGNVLTNDILLDAKIVNKPSKPYIIDDLNIALEELNLNTVASTMSDFEADNTRASRLKTSENFQVLPLNTLIINNAKINADKILIKKAKATDFVSHITLDENRIINIDKYGFNIANGTVDGDIKYNLEQLEGSASMNIKNTDAQIISENFFDMPGQVYGIVTGNLTASCKGITSVDCVNSLSGEGNFTVSNGRMPKLGSLEYLLKASNLITGGVTGVSINGIIDLITPLKTGEFKSIAGKIHVKNGIADEINVYSSGTDLNMYMTGSYNISTLVADMEIYGSLSKNISTILGKISNASLNTLFNTIPGVKINDINPTSTSNILKIPNFDKNNVLRVFKAEIYGDINGNNYVKSFKWIKD